MKKTITILTVLIFITILGCTKLDDKCNDLSYAYNKELIYVGQSKTDFFNVMVRPDSGYFDTLKILKEVMYYKQGSVTFIEKRLTEVDLNENK